MHNLFVICHNSIAGPESDNVFNDFKFSPSASLSGPSFSRGGTMTNGVSVIKYVYINIYLFHMHSACVRTYVFVHQVCVISVSHGWVGKAHFFIIHSVELFSPSHLSG